MKILDMRNKIKVYNFDKIVLIRMGNFFTAFLEDSMLLEKYLKLKRTCFAKNICKVGIPISSLAKYIDKFNENKISYIIYDYSDKYNYEYNVNEKYYIKKFEKKFDNELCFDFKLNCENCKYNKYNLNNIINNNVKLDNKNISSIIAKNNEIINKIDDLRKSIEEINSELISKILNS